MLNKIIYLQMFAEGGGDGAGSAAGSEGGAEGQAESTAGVAYQPKHKGKSNPLANVVYGTSEPSADSEGTNATPGTTTNPTEDNIHAAFEDMIKKGGQYHDEFQKKTQAIINDRFKETKGLQETLDKQSQVLNMFYDKYGIKAGDTDALTKAVNDDSSFYEQAAFDAGLTVEQYKHMKELERQNAEFNQAKEAQERRENSQRIYQGWVEDANAMAQKYNLQNFSLDDEVQNPEFTKLLANGVSVEGAYKAIHFDDMVGGAMASTAQNVRQQLVNSVAARQSRPAENGVNPQSSKTFKTDVSKLSKQDRAEIARRAARGERISFG